METLISWDSDHVGPGVIWARFLLGIFRLPMFLQSDDKMDA